MNPQKQVASTDAGQSLQASMARIHYHRPDGDDAGWGLHVWGDTTERVTWNQPLKPHGRDDHGIFWNVRLTADAERVGFIVHRGDVKDPGPDLFLELAEHGHEVWLVSGRTQIHGQPPEVAGLTYGDLSRQRAHWIARDVIVWQSASDHHAIFRLHASASGNPKISAQAVGGDQVFELQRSSPEEIEGALKRFPHLATSGSTVLRLPSPALDQIEDLLRGPLAVSVSDSSGRTLDATGLQIAGVLDDVFAYAGPLGVTWNQGRPSLHLWAPTARAVRLLLFDAAGDANPTRSLELSENQGVWSTVGEADWKWRYYLYEVEVFVPSTGRIEHNRVTDPYSRSLSLNSTLSQFVDLNDPATKPPGWDGLVKPRLESPLDIVLYELHVRDFSASDATVPEQLRGTYLAFTVESDGTRHLRRLATSGVTHVHLLPVFDIATINEDRSSWRFPVGFENEPPDSERPQAVLSQMQAQDPYNWGYDPLHYGVPEGSYASHPNGESPRPEAGQASAGRISEFRSMVQALAGMGLRVVMDVVYNHTHASGLAEGSVLDKIVPGYYHRLNADGEVETSTCCQNTASEHVMMERLILDDLIHWATDYKVDGFRFDLMGHHLKRNMLKFQRALGALRPEVEGVDGGALYLYGEGWDFGEVAHNARGENATQKNMAGTGIGTFNDRLRDAARGGNPFGDRREQGFITGLHLVPNGFNQGGADDRARLLEQMDRIRIGLTGNLASFRFRDRHGQDILGSGMSYGGYTAQPQECINYVSAHDNETLFDKIQFAAAPGCSMQARLRMQNLGISLVALAQGIPFFHAGIELLRSKSLDADSYNSGDWFNRLDLTYASNNFGVGLPPAGKNRERWDLMRPLLARAELRPEREDIQACLQHFCEMLRIRRSSPLFRLGTAEEIRARLRFHNTGPEQIPGLIVMSLANDLDGLPNLDPAVKRIFVLFNASPESQRFEHHRLRNTHYELHPIQVSGSDPIVQQAGFDSAEGAFVIPGRTTAVFIQK